MANVTVVMPTMGRAGQAVACINTMRATAGYPFELIVPVEVDEEGAQFIRKHTDATVLFREEHRGPVYGWNEGARTADGADVFVLAADDLIFEDGWLATALGYLSKTVGFVGFNDGHRNVIAEKNATHFLATRAHLLEVQGGVLAIPVYKHYGFDNEMTERAMSAGDFAWARNAITRHEHPQWKTREWDDTYQRGKPWRTKDRDLFFERKRWGWPINYEPVLEAR